MKKQLLILLITIPISATAATDFSLFGTDVSLSGFATAGFAISDQTHKYDRFVNNDGTFKRNSLIGGQIDIKLNNEFSITAQAKVAPSADNDKDIDTTLTWAFLSWRPTNDWLVRLGKQRMPLYMYSETLDVGATYDFAVLPIEMYKTVPCSDYLGGSVSKNWDTNWGELSLEGYLGQTDSSWRAYKRDNIQIPESPLHSGANYFPFKMNSIGTILTLSNDENKYRAGFHYKKFNMPGNQSIPTQYSLMPASYFVPEEIAPAFNGSAYTVLPENMSADTAMIFTLGMKYQLPNDFFLLGEYSLRVLEDADTGFNSNGGYISLFKEIEGWTPYVSFAMLKTMPDVLNLYQKINTYSGISVNPAMTNPETQYRAKLLNASQRQLADVLLANDQHTIAIGTSYRLTPTQKLKFEWAQTHVGINSSFVNAPSDTNVDNENIDIFSFSYNVAF